MSTYPTFPDGEAVLRTWLAAKLTELSDRVYSSVPPRPTYPLATVARVAGVPAVRQYLDAPTIDVNVWGNSKSEAQGIAQRARRFCHELEGRATTTPVASWVAGVEDVVGLTYLQDEETNVDRYVFSVRLYIRAN